MRGAVLDTVEGWGCEKAGTVRFWGILILLLVRILVWSRVELREAQAVKKACNIYTLYVLLDSEALS